MDAFNFKGHIAFGFVLAILLKILGVPMTLTEAALLLFGSLVPDLDHRNSTLGQFNLLNRTRMIKHRGKFHTVIGCILLCVPFYVFSGTNAFVFVLIGAVGHLCADKLYSVLPPRKRKRPFAIRIW